MSISDNQKLGIVFIFVTIALVVLTVVVARINPAVRTNQKSVPEACTRVTDEPRTDEPRTVFNF